MFGDVDNAGTTSKSCRSDLQAGRRSPLIHSFEPADELDALATAGDPECSQGSLLIAGWKAA
jgi:hypothetical protein